VPAEHGVSVATSGADQTGPRLIFQMHSNWVLVPGAGQIAFASGQDPGIYTVGQMQCMAVIAVKFGSSGWDACLVHISHGRHSLLDRLEQFVDANTYVAIGAKPASLNWMLGIKDRFVNKVRGVWIYVGRNQSPDFGMNREGYFGETVSWVSAVPSGT
jgi:hypothetical protein